MMARDMFDTFAACAGLATLLVKLKVMYYWAADSQDQKPSGESLSLTPLSHSMIHAIDRYRACAVSLSVDSLPLQSGYLLGGSMTLSKDD